MPESNDPTVLRRRLRIELRTLRSSLGLKQRDVAKAMGWSDSKMIRIENGDVSINPHELSALLAHYGVDDRQRIDRLVELARASRGFSWSDFRDAYSAADLAYFGFESAASAIRVYEPTLVSGLLQTEDYAHTVLADTYLLGEEGIVRRWAARQRRQEMHARDDPPEMSFLFEEAVVRRWIGGPNVMRLQLEQLQHWSALDHITLRVLPYTVGAHPGLTGPFTVLEFEDPKDDDLLYQEHSTGAATTRDDTAVTGRYKERFYDLEKSALSSDETFDLIDQIIREMTDSQDIAG